MSRRTVLPVSLLDDRWIESTDYPDWATTCHTIKTAGYDRDILDDLMTTIPAVGVEEPLTLGVRRASRAVLLSDGHHRAVALIELGIKTFPYRWFWTPYTGCIRFEKGPLPDDVIEGWRTA